MEQNFKELSDKINKRNISESFKRGIIQKVYLDFWTADVQVVGSTQTLLKNIPLSSAVPLTVAIGDWCRLDLFDETNSSDMVVAYIYKRRATLFTTVNVTILGGTATGTAVVAANSMIVGYYPIQNMSLGVTSLDLATFIRDMNISGTTLTVNCVRNAYATIVIAVILTKIGQ